MDLKPGLRLASAVCATEVVVVKAPAAAVDLRCGGQAMVAKGEAAAGGGVDPAHGEGTVIGKRYGDEDRRPRVALHEGRRGIALDRRRAAAPQGRQAAAVVGLSRHAPVNAAGDGRRDVRRPCRLRLAGRRAHLRRAARPGAARRGVGRGARASSGSASSTSTRTSCRPCCSVPASPACPFVPMNYRLADDQLATHPRPHRAVRRRGRGRPSRPASGTSTVSSSSRGPSSSSSSRRSTRTTRRRPTRRRRRTSPSCCSRAGPPATPRRPSCATGTSPRTSSAPSTSWAPTRTRPRW